MGKIVTLKDKITQEDIYPVTSGKSVLDKNGSSILGVLDSEIRNFSETEIRDGEILMEQSLAKISELSGLSISDSKVRDLAGIVVENELTKQEIESLKKKIEKIKENFEKPEVSIEDLARSNEVIELVNIFKAGKPTEDPIGKELRLDEEGNFYIGIDGVWYVTTGKSEKVDLEKDKEVEEEIPFEQQYFTVEALEDGLTAKLSTNACEYRVDNGDWSTLSAGTDTVSINIGQILQFKAELTPTLSNGIGTFTFSKNCNLRGNIMSLLYKDDFINKTDLTDKDYTFNKLFYNSANIVNANKLILPATTLASYCYLNMFTRCTRLTTAPELPATTLATGCYYYMFLSCTDLTEAPELSATTLATSCYIGMFNGCTSLTTAPELLATTLVSNCYKSMFKGCSNLNYIKALFTTKPSSTFTSEWVSGVSSTGTFVKNSAATWNVRGSDSIPEGWTVETVDVPSTYAIREELEQTIVPGFLLNIDTDWIDSVEVWYKASRLDVSPGEISITRLMDAIKVEYPGDDENSWKYIYFKITTFIPGDSVVIYQNGEKSNYTINDSGDYILPDLNIGDIIEIKTIQS